MYGDTRVIRTLARDLREQADDIVSAADRLVGEAEQCPWSGWAADAMRQRCRDQAGTLRVTARHHVDAAEALEHHADEVDRLKDLIAAIERRVQGLISGARDRIAEIGHGLVDGLKQILPDRGDELLDRFVPPPPGHKEWLDVELPGLHR